MPAHLGLKFPFAELEAEMLAHLGVKFREVTLATPKPLPCPPGPELPPRPTHFHPSRA